LGVALAGGSGLFGRGGPFGGGTAGRGFAAFLATLAGGRITGLVATAGAGFVATAIVLVDRGPGATLGFIGRDAPLFIALLDMLGLALLLVGIGGFVTLGHGSSPCMKRGRHGWDKGSAAISSAGAGNRKNRSVPHATMSG